MKSEFTVEYVGDDEKGLKLAVSGRIDASNFEDVSAAISKERSAHPQGAMILDMDGLYYTSSAGLRILLTFAKEESEKIQMLNLDPDLFDIFEDAGFTNILDITQKEEA